MSSDVLIAIVLVIVLFWFFRPRADVDGASAKKLIEDGGLLVDVRSPGEFAGGHIDGAVNMPLNEVLNQMEGIPKDRPIVLYCASGMRSGNAAKALKAAGFLAVHNLGAMHRWEG